MLSEVVMARRAEVFVCALDPQEAPRRTGGGVGYLGVSGACRFVGLNGELLGSLVSEIRVYSVNCGGGAESEGAGLGKMLGAVSFGVSGAPGSFGRIAGLAAMAWVWCLLLAY